MLPSKVLDLVRFGVCDGSAIYNAVLSATAGHDALLPIDVTLSGAQSLPARPDSAKAIDLENCITLRCERLAGVPALKMLSEYIEHALTFERLAAQEQNPKLKAELESQAKAYRKLAAETATKFGLPLPSPPPDTAT